MTTVAKVLPSGEEMQAAADALYKVTEQLEDLTGRMPDPESDPNESEWEPVTADLIGELYGSIEEAAQYAEDVAEKVEGLGKALSLASEVSRQQAFTRRRAQS